MLVVKWLEKISFEGEYVDKSYLSCYILLIPKIKMYIRMFSTIYNSCTITIIKGNYSPTNVGSQIYLSIFLKKTHIFHWTRYATVPFSFAVITDNLSFSKLSIMSRESLFHVKVTVDIREIKIKIIVDWKRQLHNLTETANKYRIEGKLDDCLMLTAISEGMHEPSRDVPFDIQ